MLDGPVVVKDNALAGTSAWANTFLGRDHQAQQARCASRTGDRDGVIIDTRAVVPARTRRLAEMAYRNLEEKLQAAGSAVEMARNSQIGPVCLSGGAERVLELEGRAGRLARDARRSSTSRTT